MDSTGHREKERPRDADELGQRELPRGNAICVHELNARLDSRTSARHAVERDHRAFVVERRKSRDEKLPRSALGM